jgi:general secretion pathway protein A
VYGRPVPAPWLKWTTFAAVAAAVALVGIATRTYLGSRPGATGIETTAKAGATNAGPAAEPAATAAAAPAAPTPVTKDEPAAIAEPPLDQLLIRHGNDTTTEAALGRLFALWGALYDPAKGRGCDQATRQSLECLFQKGSWAQLRALNRPAILTLTDDIGRSHQVVLTGLDDDHARIDLGGAQREFTIAAMSRYWFGDFLLLWRPPLAVVKALAPGMRGEDVRWLRDSLRTAQGLPVTPPGSDVYDEELVQLVQDFQRQHRLAVDGVAGVQTQIALDTALNATGSPTIVVRTDG